MKRLSRYAAGALMLGAFLFGGGTQQVRAAACTNAETLGGLETSGGCTLGDKTFSNFSSTAIGTGLALPGTTPIEFAIITISGVPQYTMTVSDPFTQSATYNLDYSVAITNPAAGQDFSLASGGLLLAIQGGTATLTKAFTAVGGGSISPNPLVACAINTVACPQTN